VSKPSRPLLALVTALLSLFALVFVQAAAPPPARADSACPWVGSDAPIEQRIAQVLGQMTLDEKIQMLGLTASPDGYENYFPAITRLCVPRLTLQDGPAGVAAGFKDVTQLPAPIDLAASWDRSVASSYGNIQGTESWGKGIEVAQGPDINIARVPENGRTFEAYGEDPFLTSQLGVANIDGIQRTGVMANVKHLAANNQETNRLTIDERIDERTLREIYLPGFEASVRQGHVATAMCAYNQINGAYACQDPWLQQQLFKDEYGFDGFIRSDFGAVHDVAAAYDSGMDQSKPEHNAELKAAVQAGKVPVSRVDDAVRRVLKEMFRYGLFEHQPTGTPDSVVTSPAHADTARDIAQQGTVLLKNAQGTLPLDTRSTKSIAVIGSDGGDGAYTAGGGSSHVLAPHVVTPYDGIEKRAGSGADVSYADSSMPTVPADVLTPASGTGSGLTGEYYDNQTWSGTPVLTRTDPTVDFTWGQDGTAVSPAPGVPAEHWSSRWTGTLTAPATGTYTFSLTSDDGSTLTIGDTSVVDNGGNHAVATKSGTIDLVQGQRYPVRLDYFNNTQGDQVHLNWLPPGTDRYAKAEQAAKDADVAVVFANDVESEGVDRPDLTLPFDQDELIEAVAAANPNTVVVLNTGGPVTMPWLGDVRGVVEAWYPGQEDGDAIAGVLFGDVNPSGKLPLTFPRSESQAPAHTPEQWPGVNGVSQYSEGLQVGYRWYDSQDADPLFPFGYGLSYTDFSVHDVRVGPASLPEGGQETVTADVTNTGQRTGAEVVQLYIGMPSGLHEPPKQLKGFEKVTLRPGQTKTVQFHLSTRDLSYWDADAHGWVLGRGAYSAMVGTSSRDIAARAGFTVPKSSGPLFVNTTAPSITPGGTTRQVTTSFTNQSSYAVRDASLSLAVPQGWTATATGASQFGEVAPSQTVSTSWRVAVPDGAAPDTYQVTGTATYHAEGAGPSRSSDTTQARVPYASLAAAYDNVGVTDDSDHSPGNFDGSGNSYSAQALAAVGITPGNTVEKAGISYDWPDVAEGAKDNVTMRGQTVAVSGTGGRLGFLGAAVSGTHGGTGVVYYTDGTTSDFTLSYPDWFSATPVGDDDLVAKTAYLNRTNTKPLNPVYLYAAYAPLDSGKTVHAVTLPDAGGTGMHVFAIAAG
jgi:beta-glucosidase